MKTSPLLRRAFVHPKCCLSYYSKCHKILCAKASDKMAYANSVDPDQTAPEGAV